jgi:porin
MAKSSVSLAVIPCLLGAGRIAWAQVAAPAPAPQPGTLTGDWGGTRTALAAKGYTFDLGIAGFYQGLTAGTGDKDWNATGKVDGFVTIDGTKAGWAKGITIDSHLVDWRVGDPANVGGGMLPSVNTATSFPENSGSSFSVSSLFATAALKQKAELMAGRINTIDLTATDPYTGGRGVERFQNSSFVAPLIAGRTTPVTTLGAFLNINRTLGTRPAVYTLAIYDPQESITHPSLDHAFAMAPPSPAASPSAEGVRECTTSP